MWRAAQDGHVQSSTGWSCGEQHRMVMWRAAQDGHVESSAGWSCGEQCRMVMWRAAQDGHVESSAGSSGVHINQQTAYLVMVLSLPAIILPDIKYLRKD